MINDFATVTCPESLQTERLILRRWRDSDLEPFAKMNSDPVVMEHFPSMLTREQTEQFIARLINDFAHNDFGLWATELKSTGEFIGFIGISRPTFDAHFMPCVEIGWRLAKEFWGKGYAPEGAREILRDSFMRVGLNELVSMTATSNLKSRRVMEKIGMTRNPQDDFDHPRVPEGHILRPHVLYRMSRQEYLSKLSDPKTHGP
jgi:ribosomal-protein-alanine N-acetyltransferase